MFKDTKEGQTYHDPEAERKARESMQDLIKESESELEKLIGEDESLFNNCEKLLCHSGAVKELFIKQIELAYNKGRKFERSETIDKIKNFNFISKFFYYKNKPEYTITDECLDSLKEDLLNSINTNII